MIRCQGKKGGAKRQLEIRKDRYGFACMGWHMKQRNKREKPGARVHSEESGREEAKLGRMPTNPDVDYHIDKGFEWMLAKLHLRRKVDTADHLGLQEESNRQTWE
jgi:hypothetical protein